MQIRITQLPIMALLGTKNWFEKELSLCGESMYVNGGSTNNGLPHCPFVPKGCIFLLAPFFHTNRGRYGCLLVILHRVCVYIYLFVLLSL